MSTLFAWLGKTDIKSAGQDPVSSPGPIATAIDTGRYEHLVLLSNYKADETEGFVDWLTAQRRVSVHVKSVSLSSPTDFKEVYGAADEAVSSWRQARDGPIAFHLSPGTPTMAAIWVLLAKARYPASLIETSRERGFREVDVPFEVAAEFLPVTSVQDDAALARLAQGLPPLAPEFSSIVHRCHLMERAVTMARRLALRDVSVLIQGESGTGKELFARAIHASSPRREKPFISVNCGAIPSELVDAEFFGYEKGAFTGAVGTRKGHFESAEGGTLFLDEVGELPLALQVRLLRVLQEKEVCRLGSSKPKPVDVRIIAATNRHLPSEVRAHRFREDLFHRLAIGILNLPPLRDRDGDLGLLMDRVLERINAEASTQPGYEHKELSAGARKLLLQYAWPGNVRELHNTLLRASIWAPGSSIRSENVKEALNQVALPRHDSILDRPLGNGFSLKSLIAEVCCHYLQKAAEQSSGKKMLEAELLGFSNYQTLVNWKKKYKVD
ncbi:MAG: sigma 54-interacting transcriptional regulator [Lautropia sp.]|nr:sigma 54-interacting transcriptional regulator [Lautropia sp.]